MSKFYARTALQMNENHMNEIARCIVQMSVFRPPVSYVLKIVPFNSDYCRRTQSLTKIKRLQ